MLNARTRTFPGRSERGLEGYLRTLLLPIPLLFLPPSTTSNLKTTHTKQTLNQQPNKPQSNQNGDRQGKLPSPSKRSPPALSISDSITFTSPSPPSNILTPYFQNAANYVAESVQGAGSQASKEANKQVAKDNDASLGSRATAAKDAVGDKFDQTSHNTKADVHKGKPLPSHL
jgi:hypothetical protein